MRNAKSAGEGKPLLHGRRRKVNLPADGAETGRRWRQAPMSLRTSKWAVPPGSPDLRSGSWSASLQESP